ncbi:MAG: hypothetical protein K8L97_16165 [Anaerolineae bacterium]|nr:hypothetical protein [Anaerolineae bacterium]
MSIAGLIFGIVVLLIALVWVIRPFLAARKPGTVADDLLLDKQRERLLMVYERTLTNIRDLDEDHTTGKMAPDDYQYEREIWVQRGIQVLKALDNLGTRHIITESADVEDIDHAIDREIEDAVAAYRTRTGT